MTQPPNATSITVDVVVVDDDGIGVDGLDASTFPPVSWRAKNLGLQSLALVDLAGLTSAWSSGGVKAWGQDGMYRLDLPNAIFSQGGAPYQAALSGSLSGKNLIASPIEVRDAKSSRSTVGIVNVRDETSQS